VADSGLVDSSRTVAIAQVGVDSILQAHTGGLLRIRADGRKETWPEAPQTISLAAATINKRQAVLATTSGELIYFEIGLDETLNEYMERKALGVGVTAMSIAEVPEGRLRTPVLVGILSHEGRLICCTDFWRQAVGCDDSTVRIISLDPSNCMETISIQALTAPSASISVAEIIDASIDKVHPTLFVNIGLQNGVLLRTVLDQSSGQLTDTRTR
jgi:splicing factor 3B subunit 3